MTSSQIKSSRRWNWTVEMKMYLLAYIVHGVKTQGIKENICYKSARQALLAKFGDDDRILSERAIEAAIGCLSKKYCNTGDVRNLRFILFQKGIDAIASRITSDEVPLVQEYLSVHADIDFEAPAVQTEGEYSVSQNMGRIARRSRLNDAPEDELANEMSSHTELASLRNTPSVTLQPIPKRKRTRQNSSLPSTSNPEAANESLGRMPGQLLKGQEQNKNLKIPFNESPKRHKATHPEPTRPETGSNDKEAKIAERNGEIESNKQLLMEHELAQERAPISRQDPAEVSLSRIAVLDGIMRTMWIPRESDNSLDPADVACVWNKCEEFLAAIFVDCVLRQPSAVDSTQVAQDFLSFLVRLFGTTEVFSIYEPGTAIRSLDPNCLKRILQAYAMDLLCEKIFLHDGWYSFIFGESTSGIFAQMRRLISATTGGMQNLRELDAMAFKLTLEERRRYINDSFLPVEARKFAEQVSKNLAPFFAEPPKICEARLQACDRSLMELKFELLYTPKQYVIERTPAGVVFDSDSMESKHSDGDGKELQVKFCYHPAMKEYDAAPITHFDEDNFDSVLTLVVAKSIVLLNPVTDRNVQSASPGTIVIDG